ncbi:hypothetical protein F0U60_01325 [Archangium minus]|uniref:Uncharacterized protein n=1 Tax=Archangium minus TaxID=83450 RepID=A0ABY9WJF0_9BACT|nr:hypothetical protein F0U60_01325 [Archangium minus]
MHLPIRLLGSLALLLTTLPAMAAGPSIWGESSMQIRQGVQDYEWLKLVSDAGEPAFARQVARALIPTVSRVTDDGAAFERARLRLIQRYQELTGRGAAPEAPETLVSPEESQTGPEALHLGADGATAGGCSASGGTSALAGVLALAAVVLLTRRRAPAYARASRRVTTGRAATRSRGT